jgi:hypothetical protein
MASGRDLIGEEISNMDHVLAISGLTRESLKGL